jgi:hypothetical protein
MICNKGYGPDQQMRLKIDPLFECGDRLWRFTSPRTRLIMTEEAIKLYGSASWDSVKRLQHDKHPCFFCAHMRTGDFNRWEDSK